eukprot:TRINITY_DN49299_c1_g1_i1.p3 TRINITY_DN49299_c1_g1~~TRINITY_DN49299_c1_g1_i1.p3  ORF type:complete len:172 (-),score=5.44 TRINITY_DN49299_c1_g1_i1:55-570(-)
MLSSKVFCNKFSLTNLKMHMGGKSQLTSTYQLRSISKKTKIMAKSSNKTQPQIKSSPKTEIETEPLQNLTQVDVSSSTTSQEGRSTSRKNKQQKQKVKQKSTSIKNENLELNTDDGKIRCDWAKTYTGAGQSQYIAYHDTEWGRPIYDDDRALFELLTLEGAQAGLSQAYH